MQDELKRYNTIGDKAGIAYFAKIVLGSEHITTNTAQKLCSLRNDIRLNFPAALAFFKYLGLIVEHDKQISASDEGKSLNSDTNFSSEFCRICLQNIISSGVIDMEAVHFDSLLDKYHIEKYGFSVTTALFRNVLLQYGALIDKGDVLQIHPLYETLFEQHQKRIAKAKTLEKLKQQLLNQELQGERAELFVLEMEKARFASSPLRDRIKRISQIDAAAGYDIVSFNNVDSTQYDCFIEVKSYAGNPHFYWSANEIDTAKLYGSKYMIVLVDDKQISVNTYKPLIIRNPAEQIINSESWLMNPMSYLVMPTDSLD